MKSICFITTGDIKTIATAKRALGLANYLVELDWKVSILMEDTVENRHRAEIECCLGVDVFFLTYSSAVDEVKKKRKIINQIHPDCLYICAFIFRNIIFSKNKCIKFVEHSELQSSIQNISFFKRIQLLLLEFYSIIYADGILNASVFLQKLFIKRGKYIFWKKTPMLYFPYAYNKEICTIVQKEHKPENEKIFVFLGSVAVNYGALVMVQAFQRLQTCNSSVRLMMLGKGADYEFIKKYIEENEIHNVVLKGYIEEEEIPAYFSNADAFLLPVNDTIQDWARCPSKLYMYLPYQKPILTSKIGEPYEVLGDKGSYFEPDSVPSLIDDINALLEKNNWFLDINPQEHEWKERAYVFNEWSQNILKI